MLPTNRVSSHPGEILQEEFLTPLGLSMNKLALDIRVPANRISEIVKGNRAVSVETAIRLGSYFGTSDEFWLNLQTMHDLTAVRQAEGKWIAGEVVPLVKLPFASVPPVMRHATAARSAAGASARAAKAGTKRAARKAKNR